MSKKRLDEYSVFKVAVAQAYGIDGVNENHNLAVRLQLEPLGTEPGEHSPSLFTSAGDRDGELLVATIPESPTMPRIRGYGGEEVCFVAAKLQHGVDKKPYYGAWRLAVSADGPLAAALLLKRMADAAEATGQPFVMFTQRMRLAAQREAEILRAADAAILTRRAAADEANRIKREKRADLLEALAPFFERAYEQLRHRKRIAGAGLVEPARAFAKAAGHDARFCARITETRGDQWLARKKAQ